MRRRLCIPLALALLVAGALLNLWRPLLLAPPLMLLNIPLYALVGLAWVPVLLVCVARGERQRRARGVMLVAAAFLASCAACWLGPQVPMGMFGASLECRSERQPTGRVQYACVADRMFMTDTYVFEGPAGVPIMWPVAHYSTNL